MQTFLQHKVDFKGRIEINRYLKTFTLLITL